MGKVKKINPKKTENPFNLRFNKIKHKVVNEKLQRSEFGSNPYQSRNRANELRKQSLLVEFKNKNKTGFIKFEDKKKMLNENKKLNDDKVRKNDAKTAKKSQTNQTTNQKKKNNSEYMSEMFEKKRLAQLERDKIENLKDKLDDKWNDLKSSFLSKELSRKESNHGKQIDSYDLIFNELLTNTGPTQRYVPSLSTVKN